MEVIVFLRSARWLYAEITLRGNPSKISYLLITQSLEKTTNTILMIEAIFQIEFEPSTSPLLGAIHK